MIGLIYVDNIYKCMFRRCEKERLLSAVQYDIDQIGECEQSFALTRRQ